MDERYFQLVSVAVFRGVAGLKKLGGTDTFFFLIYMEDLKSAIRKKNQFSDFSDFYFSSYGHFSVIFLKNQPNFR